jgi:hypothetical protein
VFAAGIEGIFKTKTESVTTIIHPFSEGWNLLSLPVTALSSSVKGIYPSAVSPAFMYQGSYSPATDVSPGEGYWIKFGSGGIVGSAGASLSNLAIPVQPRWNLVGSLSSAVSVSDITSEPPGIRTSNFYRYDGTYSVADSLRPGDGYWVKANQTGTLFLSTSGPASAVNRITIVPDGESPPAPPDRNIDELSRTAKAFALEQNYPNPFNPATAIRYRIPEDARVTLKIYDLLGRQILVLVDRIEPAGEKIVTFDAHTLPSGVYYYKLVAGARSGIKKMLVIK